MDENRGCRHSTSVWGIRTVWGGEGGNASGQATTPQTQARGRMRPSRVLVEHLTDTLCYDA